MFSFICSPVDYAIGIYRKWRADRSEQVVLQAGLRRKYETSVCSRKFKWKNGIVEKGRENVEVMTFCVFQNDWETAEFSKRLLLLDYHHEDMDKLRIVALLDAFAYEPTSTK